MGPLDTWNLGKFTSSERSQYLLSPNLYRTFLWHSTFDVQQHSDSETSEIFELNSALARLFDRRLQRFAGIVPWKQRRTLRRKTSASGSQISDFVVSLSRSACDNETSQRIQNRWSTSRTVFTIWQRTGVDNSYTTDMTRFPWRNVSTRSKWRAA